MTPNPTMLSPGFAFSMVPVGYAIGVMIMMVVLAAALAVIGYFIRDLKTTMTEKDKAHDKAIVKLGNGFNEFQVHSAETYVTREDFVRSLIKLESKIDDQGRVLRSVARDLNRSIGKKGGSDVAS